MQGLFCKVKNLNKNLHAFCGFYYNIQKTKIGNKKSQERKENEKIYRCFGSIVNDIG